MSDPALQACDWSADSDAEPLNAIANSDAEPIKTSAQSTCTKSILSRQLPPPKGLRSEYLVQQQRL